MRPASAFDGGPRVADQLEPYRAGASPRASSHHRYSSIQ